MAVKGSKEAIYKQYEKDLLMMLKALEEFILRCTNTIAEAEELKIDNEDAAKQTMTETLQGFASTAEHHLGGAKYARRFQAMMG